ncbi:MAG TPA: hypothetical protein VMW82_01615 [Candidatus Paceibacterota bacterium]|nr:hypothetical protein [Candidatus Paceibacterota bacterium]
MENETRKTKKRYGEITASIFTLNGLVLFFGNRTWFPDFYNPKFMAMAAFASAFLIILPRLIYKVKDDPKKQQSLNLLEVSLIIGLGLSGLGGLGLFRLSEAGFEYDKLIHFLVPFIFTIVICYFGSQWYGWSFKKSVILGASLVFIGGIIWEIFEFLADTLLGTQMRGYYGEFIVKDTTLDMIFNMLGIISGVLVSTKLGRFIYNYFERSK